MNIRKVTHEVEHFLTSLIEIPLFLSFYLLKYSIEPLRLFSASAMQALGKRKLMPRLQGLNI